MTNDRQSMCRTARGELTAEEQRIALALVGCPESKLYRGGERLSLAEVGVLLGLCRERVRQLEARALRRIRARMLLDPAAAQLIRKLYAMTNDNQASQCAGKS